MIELLSTGTIVSGVKAAWASIEWLWRRSQAHWDAVTFKATMRKYDDDGWYFVGLQCLNDKPFDIEVLSLRTIKPKGLSLRKNDGTPQQDMVVADPKQALALQWTVAEKGWVIFHPQCVVYVNLEGQTGDLSVDFEITVRLLNNRRPEKKVWVRTNSVKLSKPK